MLRHLQFKFDQCPPRVHARTNDWTRRSRDQTLLYVGSDRFQRAPKALKIDRTESSPLRTDTPRVWSFHFQTSPFFAASIGPAIPQTTGPDGDTVHQSPVRVIFTQRAPGDLGPSPVSTDQTHPLSLTLLVPPHVPAPPTRVQPDSVG